MEVIPEKIYNRLHATTKKTGEEKNVKASQKRHSGVVKCNDDKHIVNFLLIIEGKN